MSAGEIMGGEGGVLRRQRRRTRLFDRGAVLMIGVGLGTAIGYAFGAQGAPQAGAPEPAPVQQAVSAAAPAAAAAPTVKPRLPTKAVLVPAQTAETNPDCTPEPSPQLVQALQSGGAVRIGVFGDSFGDGVYAALYHRFPHAKSYDVLRFSQPSTGFTRYQQLDLEEKLKEQLQDGRIDVAVINFGANDDQGLIEDGHGVKLLGGEWRRIYADRAERYVETLRAQGASVYWMGLPRMRKDAYDHDLDQLQATISERMAKLGVPYIPVRSLSVDAAGQYNDYLTTADGKSRLMRAGDGIHMTYAGYARLSEPVARQIDGYVDHARAVAAGAPAGPAPARCIAMTTVSAEQPSSERQ